ncbi:TPA: RHS repeat-associated core domain-containing protein [Elizabethkingia anophelis]
MLEAYFDAWGNRQIGGDNNYLDRGYMGHEHFEDIGIIHMNGRLYDPSLRRFLNVDEIDEGDSPIPLKSINNERGKIYLNSLLLSCLVF